MHRKTTAQLQWPDRENKSLAEANSIERYSPTFDTMKAVSREAGACRTSPVHVVYRAANGLRVRLYVKRTPMHFCDLYCYWACGRSNVLCWRIPEHRRFWMPTGRRPRTLTQSENYPQDKSALRCKTIAPTSRRKLPIGLRTGGFNHHIRFCVLSWVHFCRPTPYVGVAFSTATWLSVCLTRWCESIIMRLSPDGSPAILVFPYQIWTR